MKKFLFAAVCTVTLVGFVVADEFGAVIMKVDGNNLTYFKTVKGGGKGGKGGGKGGKGGFGGGKKDTDAGEQKGVAAASVKVNKGEFDMDTFSFKAGEAIEGGLKNDMFKNIDQDTGVNVTLTTDDKGQITQIVTKGKGGFGKGKKADK